MWGSLYSGQVLRGVASMNNAFLFWIFMSKVLIIFSSAPYRYTSYKTFGRQNNCWDVQFCYKATGSLFCESYVWLLVENFLRKSGNG